MMGLQLIFVVETNRKCNSDWIYIKETIEHYFIYDNTQIKLQPVYLGGKHKYASGSIQNQINKLIKQYKGASKNNFSKVLYCFDCDEYDHKMEDQKFLDHVQMYCKENRYEFIWFCKDIERVYINKKVEDSQKKKEATRFKEKKLIQKVNINQLKKSSVQNNTSNLVKILNSYKELTLK